MLSLHHGSRTWEKIGSLLKLKLISFFKERVIMISLINMWKWWISYKMSHNIAACIWLGLLFVPSFAVLTFGYFVLFDWILENIHQSLPWYGTTLQIFAFELLLYFILSFFGRNDPSCRCYIPLVYFVTNKKYQSFVVALFYFMVPLNRIRVTLSVACLKLSGSMTEKKIKKICASL